MRSTRAAASAAAALLSLGLLAGCGGDESEPDTSSASEEQRGECEAEVEVTGAVKASWSGEGFVVTENRSGPTLYKSTDGANSLTLLAANGDFPAVAALSTKKGTYSGSEGSIDVDDEGSGATAEVTLQSGSGKSADLVATVTC